MKRPPLDELYDAALRDIGLPANPYSWQPASVAALRRGHRAALRLLRIQAQAAGIARGAVDSYLISGDV